MLRIPASRSPFLRPFVLLLIAFLSMFPLGETVEPAVLADAGDAMEKADHVHEHGNGALCRLRRTTRRFRSRGSIAAVTRLASEW